MPLTLAVLGATIAVLAQTGPLRIVVIEGEGAVNIVQHKTALAPVIEVRDQNNLPVAGAVVRFTIGGGKHATFAGGSQTLTVTTNAAGRAAAGVVNPLSSGSLQIQVQATFQGQTAVATVAQTNVAAAAQAGNAAATASGGAGSAGGVNGVAIAAVAAGAAAGGAALALTRSSEDSTDSAGGPDPRVDAAALAAAGSYVLETVNGAGLPAVTVASPPATCQVVTDNATLTLSYSVSQQFYELIESSRTECRSGPSAVFRSSTTGTWRITGATISFTAGGDNFTLDDATLSGSTLTMTVVPPHIDAGRQAPRVTTVWRK